MAERAPIRVLEPHVANQIAAGEVIERPASVVKELVENAIDAGAERIDVAVRDGGTTQIRVSDDGCGLPPEEAALAFARHATSKLQSAGDLQRIATLGFRGEALPSIASVADVTMLTRTAGNPAGSRVRVKGAAHATVEPAGCPVGTEVEVRDLFFNTPARAKFLKSTAAENRAVAEYVEHLALAHPEIAFKLAIDGRERLNTPGTGQLAAAVMAVHSTDLARRMLPLAAEREGIRLFGLLGPPELARGNRNDESLFVNGRWVQSRLLASALERGYGTLLGSRRYPVAVVHLDVPPDVLDVNVHPAKAEIRFRYEQETYRAMLAAVRDALLGADLFPQVGEVSGPRKAAEPRVQPQIRWHAPARPEATVELPPPADRLVVREQPPTASRWVPQVTQDAGPPTYDPPAISDAPPPARADEPGGAAAHWRAVQREVARSAPERSRVPADEARALLRQAPILGQFANTYIACAAPGGLWLIDQHVAHERILYEQVLAAGRDRRAQPLLLPIDVELPPALAAVCAARVEAIAAFGIELEPFGARAFRVRTLPVDVPPGRIEGALTELLDVLTQTAAAGDDALFVPSPSRFRAAALIACRSAIKAGDALQPEEMRALLVRLAQAENPFSCPHGRPIAIEWPLDEIERRFGRA